MKIVFCLSVSEKSSPAQSHEFEVWGVLPASDMTNLYEHLWHLPSIFTSSANWNLVMKSHIHHIYNAYIYSKQDCRMGILSVDIAVAVLRKHTIMCISITFLRMRPNRWGWALRKFSCWNSTCPSDLGKPASTCTTLWKPSVCADQT